MQYHKDLVLVQNVIKRGEDMGFTFRKSIKIGKNTRINLSSKGGVGISTGVKGARVSVNKQGA